jgi:translation initiation factor IF-2
MPRGTHCPTPQACVSLCVMMQVRCERVIYRLIEDVGELVVGAAPKEEHEVVTGLAEVLQIFNIKASK